MLDTEVCTLAMAVWMEVCRLLAEATAMAFWLLFVALAIAVAMDCAVACICICQSG